MSDPNPYQSPRTGSHQNCPAGGHRRSNLAPIILPVVIGCITGYLFGPMIARGPGDPAGHFVGTALVGALGLGVGILIRFIASRTGLG